MEVRTEYVHVPTVDRRTEALEEALAREVKTFPVHANIVARIRHTAESIFHGDGIERANRGAGAHRGIGWSDSEG